jgi:hypothetical protein
MEKKREKRTESLMLPKCAHSVLGVAKTQISKSSLNKKIKIKFSKQGF